MASSWLSAKNMSPCVLKAEYAVRGPLLVRAEGIANDLEDPDKKGKYPYDQIIFCNIGNPQALGQMPLTFNRQVMSAVINPSLLKLDIFPKDVISRAQSILSASSKFNSVGAYTHSQGFASIRKTVAKFIEDRDRPLIQESKSGDYDEKSNMCNPNDIFLTDGASPGIKYILQCLVSGESDGIMLPIPQYPLYSATVSLLNGSIVPYFLQESDGWGLNMDDFQSSFATAKKKGIKVKAVTVINPGNPTGQCLSRENIAKVIEFARENGLVILADEVYQENIYDDSRPFVSFRSVLKTLGYTDVELISFHSVSKGVLGECGLRGGYMEMINVCESGHEQLYKMASINLCPNVAGQICVDLMCNQPKPGDESFELFNREYTGIFDSLKRRASILSDSLNKIPGIESQKISGAMYAFPTISLPAKIVQAAQEAGSSPDAFYCMALLEKTGICVVPGSGFGQKEGSFHFRTTLLPPESEIQTVVKRLAQFHVEFTQSDSIST